MPWASEGALVRSTRTAAASSGHFLPLSVGSTEVGYIVGLWQVNIRFLVFAVCLWVVRLWSPYIEFLPYVPCTGPSATSLAGPVECRHVLRV